MTELLIVATGEVIEAMTEAEAREITRRINSDLDGIASHYESVMPLIREALTRQAWAALGYNGPSDYIAAEFDGSMRGLPREVRQVVVAELSAAGMSTRAIAPVVGVSHETARQDAAGVNNLTPEPEPEDEDQDPLAGWSTSATEALTKTTVTQTTKTVTEPITPVIGIDGKRYQRPTPAPTPAVADDNWVVKNAEQRVEKFAEALATLELAQHQEARSYTREAFATHADAVRPAARALHTPQHIRATAEWLTLYADELEGSRK